MGRLPYDKQYELAYQYTRLCAHSILIGGWRSLTPEPH
jgi:hypothetical protein